MRHLCSWLVLLVGLTASSAEPHFQDGDIYRLAIHGIPVEHSRDLARDYTIDGDAITLPILGRIPTAGLTVEKFAAEIEKRLIDAKIFTHPKVTFLPQRIQGGIVVGGDLRNPGRQAWVAGMTLTQVIPIPVSGPTNWGDRYRIIRHGKATVFSWKAIRKDPALDPKLLEGDLIEVDGGF